MATNPLTDIVLASANLKAVAPQLFDKLVDAFRSLETQAIVEAVSGDEAREIFRAQGKVKLIQSLRKNMQECVELRATYERRGSNG